MPIVAHVATRHVSIIFQRAKNICSHGHQANSPIGSDSEKCGSREIKADRFKIKLLLTVRKGAGREDCWDSFAELDL